jgi:hypothetical protein
LREFEDRVLGRILGYERGEVTAGLRKLHCKELHHFHSSPSIINWQRAKFFLRSR